MAEQAAESVTPSVTPRIADAVQGHYPVEVQPIDIAHYKHGNTGVDFVHVLDSGRPGPTVMLQALTHGNEFCGAYAIDYLLREKIKPSAGKLVIAFANVDAYARFDFDNPDASRYIDEDYNRVWADEVLHGARDSAELRRARKLQPFVDAADLLLDIHSMHEPCRPIMVCGMVDKHAAFARKVGVPADLLLDTGHPAGLRMRDRGSFNDPASPRTALLIECGQHWEKSAVDVAVDTMLRFLAAAGSVPSSSVASRLRITPPKQQRVIRVTEAVVAKSMNFEFVVPTRRLGHRAEGRYADCTRRRHGVVGAVRQHGAGDAVVEALEARQYASAVGPLRGLAQRERAMTAVFASQIRSAVLLGAAVVALTGCAASTELNAQWVNPQAGNRMPVKSVMVMGINRDATARRIYEDSMVAQLATRGVKAVQSYKSLPDDGPAEQKAIQAAVTGVGADAVLISRTLSVTNQVRVSPGFIAGYPWGYGFGGFYGYYQGFWSAAYAIPPTVYTYQNVLVDTRLFDAKEYVLLWSGSSTTVPTNSMQQTLQEFAKTISDSLARDRAI